MTKEIHDDIPSEENDQFGIAIVGMACRFPDARNVNEFWNNLQNGVESIRSFTEDELKSSGVDEKTLRDPGFVNAGTVMPDADAFDAPFFGINAREAEIMDLNTGSSLKRLGKHLKMPDIALTSIRIR